MSTGLRFSRTRMLDYHSLANRFGRITRKGKFAETLRRKQCKAHADSKSPPGSTMCSSEHRAKPSTRRRRLPRNDGSRRWIYSPRDRSGFHDKLVIVSYNILGVENASRHPDLYHNIPYVCLDWNNRKELIFNEMKSYSPDILCFQEVDCFHDLNNGLHKDGLRGVYKARTGDANDGCAIFWKEERFTLLHEEHIEFQKFGLRNNVAQFCVLKMTSDEDKFGIDESQSKCLVVGNIHVLFNPNRGDVKLGQIRLFLEKARKLSEEWGGIPVVLAGDMNSVPQSAMYEFMSTEKLDLLKHQRRTISGQFDRPFHHRDFPYQNEGPLRPFSRSYLCSWSSEELELATGDRQLTLLQNPLKLSSAYHGVPGNSKTRDCHGEPLATSYHSKFMGTVDYIWHTEELSPVRVLDTLSFDALRRIGGLPSQAITALKKGAHLLKYGRRGKPKFCPFRLSNDESVLIWISGKEEKHLKLSHVSRIISGQRTPIFQRYPRPEKEYQSFSLIYNDRSLYLICKDKDEAELWFSGLKALISRCHQRKWKTESRSDGILSEANSPHAYTRRSSPLHSPFDSANSSVKDGSDNIHLHSPYGSPLKNGMDKAIADDVFYFVPPKGFSPTDPASGPIHSFVFGVYGHMKGMTMDTFRMSMSSVVSSSSHGFFKDKLL